MAQNPFAKYAPAQAGPLPAPPPDPYKAGADERAARDQQMQEQKFAWEREQREKDREAGVNTQSREGENKAAAFLIRALGANASYETQNIGARSLVGQQIAEIAPGPLNSLPESIGNSPRRQVADTNQDEFIAASLRQDSGAAIPEPELERQRRIYFPVPGDTPQAIEAKRQARLRAIEGLKQSAGRLAEKSITEFEGMKKPEQAPEAKSLIESITGTGGDDNALPGPSTYTDGAGGVPPSDGAPKFTPPEFSPADPQNQAATGETRRSLDPQLGAQIDAMLRGGSSYDEINAFVMSKGGTPIIPRQFLDVQNYMKAHPGYKGGFSNVWREEPISATEQAITKIGASAPGAYAIGAGRFLTGETLDELAPDPEKARQAMQVVESGSPTASTLGKISGGVMGSLVGEAALARVGMRTGVLRSILADTGQGAAIGAGSADEGNRIEGAVQGGVAAAAGNLIGTTATKGIAKMVSPTGGKLSDLYASGVRPTPGQRFVDSGVAGRALNATEEALQSIPVIGAAIHGARQEARDQFQIGAFNEALREVGEQLPAKMKPGTAPHAHAQDVFNRVYDQARSGMRLVPDGELANDLNAIDQQVGALAEPSVKRFNSIFQNIVARRADTGGGMIAGREYKRTISDLGKQIRSIRNNPNGDYELASALEDLQGALENTARRHSPPEAVQLIDAADAGYAKFVRIEEASKRAGGDAGTFSPTQFERAVQKEGGGIRSKAFLRGEALMQDYAEQGKSLVDRLPNSGTVDRGLAAGAIAGGATYFSPAVGAFLGAIGTTYAPGIRRVLKGAFAPSGQRAQAIQSQLRKRARLIGASGAATGAVLLPGTSAGQ